MDGLFHMVAFHIGDAPDILGVLAEWITGELSGIRPLEVLFARILGCHTHVIQIEGVSVSFRRRVGIPKNDFVAP